MRRTVLAALAIAGTPVQAQTVVTSAAPDKMSVTVYRDPNRGDGTINARFPRSFALISEKRRIAVPAGDSVIRFEGVADGMMAVSAVVTGLPGGVVQKNRDARLLSPAALVDGTLGNGVHLRRTNRQTGQVTEQDAIIRSTAANGLVLETAQGVEALRCSGLPETIVQDRLPSGLSVRPTMSVTTSSNRPVEADVTLTYLATGFDWGASYVVRLAPDGRTLDLFAWLTVANGNATSFPQADLLAVGGRVNRGSRGDPSAPWQSPSLTLQCWPEPSYEGAEDYAGGYPGAPPPPPPAPMAMMAAQDIMVTARRVAEPEDLGDLKLYRVPMPVDVNANGQKQVALLHRPAIAYRSYYSALLALGGSQDSSPLRRMIRFINRKEAGAGLPLPSGALSVFAPRGPESLLLGEARMRDHAMGETVEIDVNDSPQYRISQTKDVSAGLYHIVLSNAGASPIAAEIELEDVSARLVVAPSRTLARRDGRWLWAVTVPGNGTAELHYRLK